MKKGPKVPSLDPECNGQDKVRNVVSIFFLNLENRKYELYYPSKLAVNDLICDDEKQISMYVANLYFLFYFMPLIHSQKIIFFSKAQNRTSPFLFVMEKEELPPTLKQDFIPMIPKPKRDKLNLENQRPINLLVMMLR